MDDYDKDQPLDSMGNPITPLNLRQTDSDKPNSLDIPEEIPKNPLAPDSDEMPMNQNEMTSIQGGMPSSSPVGMGEMPMDQPMDQFVGQPMMGQPMDQPMMGQPMDQPMGQSMGQPMMGQPMQGYSGYNQGYNGYGQAYGGGMPMGQPVDYYGPSMGGMNTMGGGQTQTQKIVFVVSMMGLAILFLVGIFFLPQLMSGGGSGSEGGGGESTETAVSKSAVESYCKEKGYEISSYANGSDDNDDIADSVRCHDPNETSKSVMATEYVQMTKSAMDYYSDEYKNPDKNATGMTIVKESDSYAEYYYKSSGTPYYCIIDGLSYFFAIFKNADDLESILTAVRGENENNTYFRNNGYKTEQTSDDDDKGKDSTGKDETDSTPKTLSGRDELRRKDITKVRIGLIEYQTNNSDKSINLPSLSKWRGKSNFTGTNDCGTNSACMFVRDYMNSGSKLTNEFEDPDGTPYSVVVTKNFSKDGDNALGATEDITLSSNSKLKPGSDGYTIGGDSPFAEHVIYIVPGGFCKEKEVMPAMKRNFAILYYFESGEVYCDDDQS